jgi:hypothetical protein
MFSAKNAARCRHFGCGSLVSYRNEVEKSAQICQGISIAYFELLCQLVCVKLKCLFRDIYCGPYVYEPEFCVAFGILSTFTQPGNQ